MTKQHIYFIYGNIMKYMEYVFAYVWENDEMCFDMPDVLPMAMDICVSQLKG